VAPGQEKWLEEQVGRLKGGGVRVDLRLGGLAEQELLDVLAAARCALLPYPRHFGMSRVLVEAAVAGTPVVAHDFGLVGHLAREHGLGAAVDCGDAGALGRAIAPFLSDPAAVGERAPALERFAAGFEAQAFAAALTGALWGGS
jgi:glycosyltransferase involved in cell wall biosynthesis